MPLIYNAAEVCIVGSQEEAGPWVAMEAMACGVPTIVMEDCAWLVAEAFKEVAFGAGLYVVPPSIEAIHDAVEIAMMNPHVDSESAREIAVKHYDWWPMYREIDQRLKNLVALRQAGQEAPYPVTA
jgi:glycosyltransferase involved in cell wall biosynthesis